MRNLELYDVNKESTHCCQFSDLLDFGGRVFWIYQGCIYCYYKLSREIDYREVPGLGNKTLMSPLQSLASGDMLYFATTEHLFFISPNFSFITNFSFETTISATAWDPRCEYLAVVFSDGTITLYSFELDEDNYECRAASHLSFECPESFAVGWGSNSTQFRGLLRNTAEMIIVESAVLITEGTVLEVPSDDDKKVLIEWRSTGDLFCVNYWKTNRRAVKIYDYQCQPVAENDTINGLQPILAWRSFGAAIASIAVVRGVNYLVLFEKNGILREEFALNNQLKIKKIKWNRLGNILAIQSECTEDLLSLIELYMITNDRLYLKQTLHFATNKLVNFKWLQASLLTNYLHVTTTSLFLTYKFRFAVNKTYVSDVEDCTLVGVIDGSSLHLCRRTSSDCVTQQDVEMPEPINALMFYCAEQKIVVFGVTSLYIYDYPDMTIPPIFNNTITLTNRLVHLYDFRIVESNSVVLFSKFYADDPTRDPTKCKVNLHGGEIENIPNYELLTAEGSEGGLEVAVVKGSIYTELLKSEDGCIFMFSLDERRNAYINLTLAFKDITSFTIHRKCMFFTTMDNLIGVRLRAWRDLAEGRFIKIYTKPIEFGSVLICGMGSSSDLMLQTPRGNTEMLSCLLINIDMINEFLEKNDWKAAWERIRVLKLNTNLLFDLDPERFLANIKDVVNTVILSVFLQEAEEDSVFNTLYSHCGFNAVFFKDKLRTISNYVVEQLVQESYIESLHAIVQAALLPKDKNSVTKALKHISSVFKRDPDCQKVQRSVEIAIKLLLKYKNIKEVYETCLSLYDLDLALVICRNSDLDPREYVDYINKLKALPINERKFIINDNLKNHSTAMIYLYDTIQCEEDMMKLLRYMDQHNLHKELYNFASEASSIYRHVVTAFGNKLANEKHYNEAGFVFEKAKLYGLALDMYVDAINWKKAIEMMDKLEYRPEQRHHCLRLLAGSLISSDRDLEASQVYEEHLDEYETAVKLLCNKYHITHAFEIVKRHSRADMIESDIEPALRKKLIYIFNQITRLEKLYDMHRDRLIIVRREKADRFAIKMQDIRTGEPVYDPKEADDDAYSVGGSTVTGSRVGSSVTSSPRTGSTLARRSRQREQRKKEDLRLGGKYEDIALLKVIYETITSIMDCSKDVNEVCYLMMERNIKKDSERLHTMYFNVLTKIKTEATIIWPEDMLKFNEPSPTCELKALRDNLFELDSVYWKPPTIKFDWVLYILQK